MTVNDLDILSRTERSRIFEFVAAFFALVVGLVAATAFLGWTMDADLRWLIILWCVSGGLAIGMVLVYGAFRVWGKLDGAEQERMREMARVFAEFESTPPAPVTLPALPAVSDTIRVTQNGVGEDVPRKLVHGFDPRDFNFLCRLLARGFKFTETYMECLELPHSHEPMGKAQAGTHYTRFMDLCVAAGVIVGREPKKSGTLVVTEYAEIVRRIKELPEIP